MCIVTAALQKVARQTVMTVEQRTEEANWFRKIGTTTAFTSFQKKNYAADLGGFSFCMCARKQLGTQLSSVRVPPTE